MRVAGIQFDIAWEDHGTNLARAEKLIRDAAGVGAELVVLPEMFATGFSMSADKVTKGAPETLAFLSRIAANASVTLIAGVAENDPASGKGRNLAVAFGPDGMELARYQKIHPFSYAKEDQHYMAGGAVCTFECRGVRVAPFICYDLRFPEIFRAVADRVELVVVIANWPEPRREHWRALLPARAIENQCYVLGVNRSGSGGGMVYAGDSALIGPLGEMIAEAPPGECTISGEIEAVKVSDVREKFPFLKDRKQGLYAAL